MTILPMKNTLYHNLSEKWQLRVALALIGVAGGSISYFLDVNKSILPVYVFIFYTTAFLQLVWNGRDVKRLFLSVTSICFTFSLLAWYMQHHGEYGQKLSLSFSIALCFYILLPFLQIYQQTHNRFSFAYKELFLHSWSNLFIMLIAGIFVTLLWLLLLLWSLLFDLIHITIFEKIFFHPAFVMIIYPGFYGFGIAIGRESEKIVRTLRQIILVICKFLTPIVVITLLLFAISLPLSGLESIWNIKYSSALLLTMIGTCIFFINGVFQEGTGTNTLPPWYKHGVSAALITLPLYACLAFFAIGMRIDQHGLTQERFYVVITCTFATLYSLSYAYAALNVKQKTWLGSIKQANKMLSLCVVGTLFFLHTPILDAYAWSTRDQVHRLLSGKVTAEQFDYAYLQFKLGNRGKEEVTMLQNITDHPEAHVIREKAAHVAIFKTYWEYKRCTTGFMNKHGHCERLNK